MIRLKTKEEIAILREGGKRHAFILKELEKMVKPGLPVCDLNTRAVELIKQGGDTAAFLNYRPSGSKTPYPCSLCVSVNDEIVHGVSDPSDRILKEGDIVTIDLGLTHKGMITDAAITVPVGKISPELSVLIEATRRALNIGIKAAKGGKRVGDIGNAIERVAFEHGYSVADSLAGHGVGYDVHEDPYVPNYGDQGKGEVLQPGLVIAIEPIFNLGGPEIVLGEDGHTYKTADGSHSAHFEHTVVITKSGAEVLTV